MNLFLLAVAVLVGSGVLCITGKFGGGVPQKIPVGPIGVFLGSVLGLVSVIRILISGQPATLRLQWPVPYASLYICIDSLSSFFLIVLFLLSALVAPYAREYLRHEEARKDLSGHWCMLNCFIASMALVLTAHNGILFLYVWEIMSLLSFFLVTLEHEDPAVRRAGFVYLVATHLGTACLLVSFIMLAAGAPNMDFEHLSASGGTASVIFLLALAGFGTKAGIVPFHVWLPEAHPAAPSHISALMSGVMIKIGIYGLLRTLILLGAPLPWWGFLLVALGVISGVLGVLLAIGQHDLKRLLAYHSVENIGIILIGVGLGLTGVAMKSPAVAALGFAGALLHVLNHAVFKGLLFLGAGAVLHVTGTRDIDRLGGLLKKMPLTGLSFLVGSIAICGIPPLNGFVSEFLIYLSAFRGVVAPVPGLLVSGAVVAVFLAMIGGLAAACFTKAFGVLFLGEARSSACEKAHEVPLSMRIPMAVLALLCVSIGLLGYLCLPALVKPIIMLTGLAEPLVAPPLGMSRDLLNIVSRYGALVLVISAGVALARKLLLRRRVIGAAGTWDCGYTRPTARMQYTASSFAQPLVAFFSPLLFPVSKMAKIDRYFPPAGTFHSRVFDAFATYVYEPFFAGCSRSVLFLQRLQPAQIHSFAVYIVLTLLGLIVWSIIARGV